VIEASHLKKYGIIFLVLFFIIHFWVKFQTHPSNTNIQAKKTGDVAPGFQGQTLEGQPFDLKETASKNKILVINFWETWCGPCKQELPYLQRIHSRFNQQGFSIIGVYQSSPEQEVQSMIQENSLTFPMVFDETRSISSQFKIIGVPTTFVVDANLKILRSHEGIDLGLESFVEEQLKELQ
jgi:peroxiredoxin